MRPGARLVLFISLGILSACVTERQRSRPLPGPRISALHPATVTAGQPFNAQPDGSSALSVTGENLFRGSRVLWNGEPLETAGGEDQRSLSAIVPKHLIATPGVYKVTVEHGDGRASNGLRFTVLPAASRGPR